MSMQALDPFCGHEWAVRQPGRPGGTQSQASGFFPSKKQVPPQELQNRAEGNVSTDPFLTKYGAMADRPRVKVSVYSAVDLPQLGERMETYCTVSVPNVTKSRLNTPVDYQNWNNPVWNFTEKQVWGWLPGKALEFEIKNKAAKTGGGFSTMLGMGEDLVLGNAVVTPDQFWPDGLAMQSVQLYDQYGNNAGKVWVEINCLGGAASQKGCCHWLSQRLSFLGKSIATIPMVLGMLWKQLFDLLKPEYPNRKVSEMIALMFVPLGVYSFVLLMLCVLRRFIHTLCTAIIAGMVILFVAMVCVGYSRRKTSQGMPYTALGGLCLLAVFLGIFAGNESWNFGWEQWFWMNTGYQYGVTAGSSPAAAIDASFVSFDSASSVDGTRAAGFRVNHNIYCAAPMIDTKTVSAESPRVSFWAIGINCCNDFGSFTCDASREISGGTGVVMLNKGMPCSDCHRDKFRLAVAKAAGTYGIVSDPNALYVKYVKNKSHAVVKYAFRSFGILLFYLALGFCIFVTLGYIANYQGWGKPAASVMRAAAFEKAHHLNPQQQARSLQRLPPEHQAKMFTNSDVPRVC